MAHAAAVAYVYVDGLPLNASASKSAPTAPAAVHNYDVLSVAMGLYNGGVGPSSIKGVRSVTVGGQKFNRFSTAWMLQGESLELYEPGNNFAWSPISSLKASDSLVWLKATFDLPKVRNFLPHICTTILVVLSYFCASIPPTERVFSCRHSS